tara:strand:- start:8224 stop:9336 length:1113 start_codon:yes stop_codon:yes gene_type:complete
MRECSRCIISELDDPLIILDDNGLCNYCNNYNSQLNELGSETERNNFIENKIKEIKFNGINKKYDCLIGLSGGLDSSYMAYWLAKKGLKPLVVHLDNGWNSEIASQNIKNICEKLKFDLYTHVINWEEFKEMQLAYLRASVVDVEVLTDHAIKAIILKLARKFKIKYVFSGFNIATESIMIQGWTYNKNDFVNIKDIITKNSSLKKLKTYPYTTFWSNLFYDYFLKLEKINLLNYINYDKEKSKEIIINSLNWKDYGGKHYESIFTKFYQAYILPEKFNIDKRKVHLANLICSNQITKIEAKRYLEQPLYESESELKNDINFVTKKLGISDEDFKNIMSKKTKNHTDFKTHNNYWNIYFKLVKILKFNFS